jgi:hypothetical protein
LHFNDVLSRRTSLQGSSIQDPPFTRHSGCSVLLHSRPGCGSSVGGVLIDIYNMCSICKREEFSHPSAQLLSRLSCTFGKGLTSSTNYKEITCLLPRPWGPTSRFWDVRNSQDLHSARIFLEIMSITCSSLVNPMQPTATHGRNIQHTPSIKKDRPVCLACNCSSSCRCFLRLSLLPVFSEKQSS